MPLLIIFWLAMAGICGAVGASKGRSFFGFFLYGLLIWPIALIHAIAMGPLVPTETERLASGDERKCPDCAELIKSEAKVCKHCGRDVPPAPLASGEIKCVSCGLLNWPSRTLCVGCGTPISQ